MFEDGAPVLVSQNTTFYCIARIIRKINILSALSF